MYRNRRLLTYWVSVLSKFYGIFSAASISGLVCDPNNPENTVRRMGESAHGGPYACGRVRMGKRLSGESTCASVDPLVHCVVVARLAC